MESLLIKQAEEIAKNLTKKEQEKLVKLDSLLRTKDFREKLKTSPAETLRAEGFDIPKDAKFVFTDDETKVMDTKVKDGVYYMCLKGYESAYVDTEEFENVAAGLNTAAITGIAISGVAALTTIGGLAIYKYRNNSTTRSGVKLIKFQESSISND